MGRPNDISLKRLLLAAVRTRFSPQIQKIKEEALDSIVERILLTAEEGKYFNVQLVQRIFSENAGFHVTYSDVNRSLQRLLGESRIELAPKEVSTAKVKVKGKRRDSFKLTDDARREIEEYERESTRRFNFVVNRLFKESEGSPSLYAAPFLKFLSVIFSKLADESVQSLTGETSVGHVVPSPIFATAMNAVKEDLKSLNPLIFETGAVNFFQENDPEYAAIKWNLAQSYHLLRTIGLDEGSLLLGKELFGNAMFYIDTNVAISALTPEEEYHAGFVALCKACNRLGVKVRACRITLDELRRTANAHINMIKNVVDQIPEGTAVKIHSDFFEIYHDRMKAGGEFTLDEVFARFSHAEGELKQQFNIDIEDSDWFVEAESNEKTRDYAKLIGERFLQMSHRKKTELACVHDSLCLQWVEECRRTTDNPSIWLVTRDHTF